MADDLDSDYLPDELGSSDEGSKLDNESSYQNVSEKTLIQDTDTNVSGNKIIFPSTTPTKKKLPKKIIYQCSFCTFQTPLRHKLKRHFIGCKSIKRRPQSKHNQITSGVNFKCEYCFFITKTLNKLKKHKQSHASLIDLGLIECSHCTFKFFTLDEYKQHMKSTSTPDGDNDQVVAAPEYVDVSSGSMWADSEGIIIKQEVCTDVKNEGDLMNAIDESAIPTKKEIGSNFNDNWTSNNDTSIEEEGRSDAVRSEKTRDRCSYPRQLKNTHNVKTAKTINKTSTELLSSADNPLACQICCREAESQLHLIVHVSLDHVKDGALFFCLEPKCSFETVSRDEMKVHLVNEHNIEEKNFSPLSDGNSQLTQSLFKCPSCFLKSTSELGMKVHEIIVHAENSDGPFHCPWPKCNSENDSKLSLEYHLKEQHGGVEMDMAHVSTYNNEVHENNATLLTCETCGHKSETEFQMKIHEALRHVLKGGNLLCPVEQCFFAASFSRHLRRHLQRVHKLGEHYFKDYGNDHPVKKYKAVKKQDATDYIGKDNLEKALEGLNNPIEGEKESTDASKSSEKKRFECQLCDFGTDHRSSERRHQKYVHTRKRCVLCNKVIRGTFEMVWHKFIIHRDDSDVDLWFLKCDLCDHCGLPMESYQHGASHKVPKVNFHTEYRKIPTGGYVTFLYSKDQQSKLSVKEEKSDVGYCIAPSGIKVLDWTKSDDEEISSPPDKQKTISIEFIGDDNEVQSKKGQSDRIKSTETFIEDDLLVMKSEFWTCKECNYETQTESLLDFHKALLHAKCKSALYQCPQRHCTFRSKYKGNFMRHMKNVHRIQNSSLNVTDNMYAREVKVEHVERFADERDDLKKDTEVMAIPPGHKSSWEPETVADHLYSKEVHHCPDRPNCLFKTTRLSDFWSHYRQSHSILSFSIQKFVCPSLHCLFDTDKKIDLKKHLEYFHKIEEKQVLEMEDTILSMKTFVCTKCSFQTKDSKTFKEHYWFKHYANRETVKSVKNSQVSCKWSLRCTVCPYETSLKKAAYTHGLMHYCKNPNSKVAFYKCFKNRKRGILRFSYSSKNRSHQCNKCQYVGMTAVSLIRHKMRRHQVNNILSKTSESKGTSHKIQIGKKTSSAAKRTKHLKEAVQTEYSNHSLSDRCIKRKRAEKPNTENLEKTTAAEKGNRRTKSSKTKKVTTELHSELKENLEDGDRPIFACEAEYSDGNEEQAVLYSTEELNEIIGVSSKAQKANKVRPDAPDSDWISALEDEILNEDELSDTEDNEVIRIEVTEDDDEENDDHNSQDSADEAALDQFIGDLSSENGKPRNRIATRIKCKNEGCSYFCFDIEEIQRHAERCKKSPVYNKIESKKEFLCQVCHITLLDKKSLQSHIASEHFSNTEEEQLTKPKPKKRLLAKKPQSTKGISGKISFKCWMCNEIIFYRGTLVNHTYVHAREEDNFKLKVRFTKYIGDTRVDTIVIKADPTYVPRESSNVPLYDNGRQRRKRRPKSATILDYDPNFTVYSCDECNFKTNLQPSLTKHKGLHWTPEKDKAFKAGKWFTCGVCFFHCFDADTLKAHSEKHKSRPGGNVNIEKVGKNSWYF